MEIGMVPIFVTSFLVGLSGAVAPGPLLAYTIGASARLGFVAGPLVSTGHALVELVVVLGLAFGLAALADVPGVAAAIGLIGGAVLLFMGVGLLRGLGAARLQASPSDRTMSTRWRSLVGGAVVTLSNPFWFLWWLTVGAALFLEFGAAAGIAGIAAFYVGHIASDFAWYSFVAGAVSTSRRVMTDAIYRVLLATSAVLLLAMGAYFSGSALVAVFA